MLLAEQGVTIEQQVIAEACGQPSWPGFVASTMRELAPESGNWDGGSVGIEGFSANQMVRLLCRTGSWAAVLWEAGSRIGHMVIVDAFEEDKQRVRIRDPWPPGTRYTMNLEDFVHWWSESAIFRRLP
jgi:filamentous hemagglutinin